MDDTIYRQAAIDALDNIKIARNASWYPYYQQALTAMSKLPSAQPEIIYCRECKYFNSYFVECNHESGLRHIKDDHDHCCYADRRKGGKNENQSY